MKNIHIGELIEEKFNEKSRKERSFTKAEFARRINLHRSTIYLLFQQKSIDIELLITISHVLEYDFIENVYKKASPIKKDTAIVGIEVPISELENIKFPYDFIHLVKEKDG